MTLSMHIRTVLRHPQPWSSTSSSTSLVSIPDAHLRLQTPFNYSVRAASVQTSATNGAAPPIPGSARRARPHQARVRVAAPGADLQPRDAGSARSVLRLRQARRASARSCTSATSSIFPARPTCSASACTRLNLDAPRRPFRLSPSPSSTPITATAPLCSTRHQPFAARPQTGQARLAASISSCSGSLSCIYADVLVSGILYICVNLQTPSCLFKKAVALLSKQDSIGRPAGLFLCFRYGDRVFKSSAPRD
jgi:hypothetical protein